MSASLAWTLVGLGLVVIAVRRRSVAAAAVTIQSLILVRLAVHGASSGDDLLAAAALAARTLGLATLFFLLITRTREPRLVRAVLVPLRRAGLGVGLALTLAWLVPQIGPTSHNAQRAVLALVAFGLVVAATRRATLFQILGVVLVENGVVLAAINLPGTSWLIEVGVAFDLTLIALVAGVFHERIFAHFGAGDTGALRSLRD
jgi:hydrogenase-4 component E